jgi:excinuclease ABC subunit C
VGESTITKLLKQFRTISNIKKAPEEELVKIVGKDRAERIRQALV